jgi:D-glycero-alpha-D-manno-heptose-7-phosphate kinase
MIISKTPFRISFFGGGTDYPDWYLENGGSVLSTTIDKYCYISARYLPPFFDHKFRISYSQIENVNKINDIQHPAVKAILNDLKFDSGLEIHVDADLPARSGIGSSSSFIVGLLNSLYALRGKRVSKRFLAEESIRYEQEVLCENVGSQDQTAAAYGGFNLIEFEKVTGKISIEPIVVKKNRVNELNDHLMLFFTGFSRIASEIAKEQVENIKKNQLELLKISKMADRAQKILENNEDISKFGKLLHESWMIKRSLSSKLTNSSIDEMYSLALDSGALGGKLLGAGGGGFMLLFVAPSKQDAVKNALSNHIYVPFEFENNGSQIIYFED